MPLCIRLCLWVTLCFSTTCVLACSCGVDEPFIESSRSADAIVIAEVTSYFSRTGYPDKAMILRVREVLKGKTSNTPLRVWGDNGKLCRPYVSRFPVGTTWVFALDKSGGSLVGALEHKTGSDDFEIQGCGTYWLRIHGAYAVGNLTSQQKQSRVLISQLKSMLGSNSPIQYGREKRAVDFRR